MSWLEDYLFSFQNRFLSRRLQQVGQMETGIWPQKTAFDWLYLGMQVAAGRFSMFLTEAETRAILDRIRLHANLHHIEIYTTGCLYAYETCHDLHYFMALEDVKNEEVIQNVVFTEDGQLQIVTSRQTFSVEIPHNKLAGLQGGKGKTGSEPEQYYHIPKNVYEKLVAQSFVGASAQFILTPERANPGATLLPELTIGYVQNDDRILAHSLTRNGVALQIAPLDASGTGSQTLTDTPSVADMPLMYVYTLQVEGKAPIIISRSITYLSVVFAGASMGSVSNAEILSATTLSQSQGAISYTFDALEQYLFVAYPKSWGLLTGIFDPQNIPYLPAFTQGYPQVRVLQIGSESVEYYLYRNNLVVNVNDYPLRFLF